MPRYPSPKIGNTNNSKMCKYKKGQAQMINVNKLSK